MKKISGVLGLGLFFGVLLVSFASASVVFEGVFNPV